MAENASDQPTVAPPSGDNVSENTAALHVAAPEVAADAVAAPPTTGAIEKADDSTKTDADAPATSDAASAPAAAATEAGTSVDKDEEGGASTAADDAVATNGTSATKKDSKKRKSISEPKGKNLKKKQSMRELHLDVKPGQLWWVRMKGYPNWPAIICDEDMLPATLLEKRPVSALRIDGTYREDFREGGKNARDRRYPVMFLGTNEFYWQVNTDLIPLDIQEIRDEVSKGERGKKTLALWNAYQIASEEHDIEHFKEVLKNHEEQVIEEIQAKAEKEAKKAEEKAKKEARKSKGGDNGDVEMENAEDGTGSKKKKTPTKKRKEPATGEAAEEQKGPKKIKLKTKGADEADTESAKKKKEKKPKVKKDETPAKPAVPELTEQEKLEKKEKNVLYLRHRLQKGFLSREVAPKEDEMAQMNDHLKSLEEDPELEVSVIRNTKINKVLKAILKIDEIPKEETYHFKERSSKLLGKWNAILGTPAETLPTPTATTEAAKPTVNGDSHSEEAPKTEEPAAEKKEEPAETKTEPETTTDKEGDATMTDAKPTEPESTSAPAADAPATTTEETKTEVAAAT